MKLNIPKIKLIVNFHNWEGLWYLSSGKKDASHIAKAWRVLCLGFCSFDLFISPKTNLFAYSLLDVPERILNLCGTNYANMNRFSFLFTTRPFGVKTYLFNSGLLNIYHDFSKDFNNYCEEQNKEKTLFVPVKEDGLVAIPKVEQKSESDLITSCTCKDGRCSKTKKPRKKPSKKTNVKKVKPTAKKTKKTTKSTKANQ